MQEVRIVILDKNDLKPFGFAPKDIQDVEFEGNEIAFTLKVANKPVKKKPKKPKKKKAIKKPSKNKGNGKKVCVKCSKKKNVSEYLKSYKKKKTAKIKSKQNESKDDFEPKKTLVHKIGCSNVSYTYNQIYNALKENEFMLKKTARELGISEKDVINAKKLKKEAEVDKELEEFNDGLED
jgi:hypothetical protein